MLSIGLQPILDLRPLEFAVPQQWQLASASAPCLDMFILLDEVARATLEGLDCRSNSLANIVQYNLYSDESFTLLAFATNKKAERTQKAGWAFIISAEYSPRAQDAAIVGAAFGPLVQRDMDQHGPTVQSAEASEAFAFHQAFKWAFLQPYPVTIVFDCAGAGFPAAGLANPSAEAKVIAKAKRAFVHYAEVTESLSSSLMFTVTKDMA